MVFFNTLPGMVFFPHKPSAHVPCVNHIYSLNRGKYIPLQHQSQTSDAKWSVCKSLPGKISWSLGGVTSNIVYCYIYKLSLNTYKADDLFSSEHVAGDSCAGDSGAGLMVGKKLCLQKNVKSESKLSKCCLLFFFINIYFIWIHILWTLFNGWNVYNT